MNYRMTFALAFIITLLSVHVAVAADWKAGVAKVNITPEKYIWMAGYGGRDNPAEGKLTDLWAKALVIQDADGEQGVIITLDLIGIDRTLAQDICESLAAEYELQRRQISICTSHTHTGPAVGMSLGPLHYLVLDPAQQKLLDDYAFVLREKVVKLVGQALDDVGSCQLSWGNGRATFAVNRRENKPYGKVAQWRTEGVLKGPIDHDVPVLAVRGTEGALKAVLFGYACHATVLSRDQWSGDYPGYAQIELERLHPECVALFWAGCGADQNPLPRRTVELAQHYGRRLADAVDSVLLTSVMIPIEGSLSTSYAEIKLSLAELPSREELAREAEASNKFVVARAKMLLKRLENGPLSQTYPYPVGCWKIGDDIQFVSLGGEVVVDYAIRLKVELSGTRTWVAGYANDVMAYVPSRRVLLEGGYEGTGANVYYGFPTAWAPELEKDIIAEVHRQLDATD